MLTANKYNEKEAPEINVSTDNECSNEEIDTIETSAFQIVTISEPSMIPNKLEEAEEEKTKEENEKQKEEEEEKIADSSSLREEDLSQPQECSPGLAQLSITYEEPATWPGFSEFTGNIRLHLTEHGPKTVYLTTFELSEGAMVDVLMPNSFSRFLPMESK